MRAPFNEDGRWRIGEHQGRQDRLQYQGRAAGRANVQGIRTAANRPRLENQTRGAKLVSFNMGIADLGGGLQRRQMLAQQAGFLAPGANVLNDQRSPGYHRQRER